jgi:hypothetical protein
VSIIYAREDVFELTDFIAAVDTASEVVVLDRKGAWLRIDLDVYRFYRSR